MPTPFFHVIYNPVAGSGNAKDVWGVISKALVARDVQFALYESQYPRHTVQLAQQIAKTEAAAGSVLLIIGGDGTLNEAITGLHLSGNPHNLPIAYIPGGSGNDFARGVHLSRKPIEALDQVLAATEPVQLDIGRYIELQSGKRGFFVNNFGIGFDAAVVNAANKATSKLFLNTLHMGSLAYMAQVIRILTFRRPFPVEVTANGKTERIKDAYLCTTTNHPYFGGGVRILPGAVPDDGLLDLIVVDRPNIVTFATQAIASIMGKPDKSPSRHHIRAAKFEISTPSKEFAQIDGEDMDEQPYRIEIGVDHQNFWFVPGK
jgi:YegS/Rv2252/BmrU family lipid kinase